MSLLPKPANAPLLCYVTDRRSLSAAQPAEMCKILLQDIAAAAVAGIDWIQLREKDLSGKECSALAREAMRLATNSASRETARARKYAVNVPPRVAATATREAARPRVRTRILINDRLDVALAADAGGVHLGEQSLPPQEARRLVQSFQREDFLVGASCHSLEAAKAAERGAADYLFFGPVFATPSKASYGAPQGLARLREVCRAVALPVLAIGGITLENAAACLSAGASGIAAIRLFQDASDLPALVEALQNLSR